MVPITRQYRQTAPMTNAVWARNHTVNAAMKPAKNVATAQVAFDSAEPSMPAPATPSVSANTLSPMAAFGIGPKTLACHDVSTLPHEKVPLMSQSRTASAFSARVTRSTS